MQTPPDLLAAKRLEGRYQSISRSGHFATASLLEVASLAGEVAKLAAPNERLVAQLLARLFQAIIEEWDEMPARATSWPKLDNVLLRATVFVAKGGTAEDAVAISLALQDAERAWLGA